MRASRQELVHRFESAGFRFLHFTLTQRGPYAPEDAEWNYKDIPHVNYVHSAVKEVLTQVEHDYKATINFQKIFGLTLPLINVTYSDRPDGLTYFTTFGPFLVVTETTYHWDKPGTAIVNTTYSMGSPRWAAFLLPVLRWITERNYHILMAEDIPMREQRGHLRRLGYEFVRPLGRYSWLNSLDLSQDYVVPGEDYQPDRPSCQIAWGELEALDEHGLLVHHNDHWGLRIVRSGNQLLFFPRVCLHEGACLDQATIRQERILCPWHGRAMQPIASLDLSRKTDDIQVVESEHHRIKPNPQGIEIVFKVRSGQPVG